MLKFVGVVVKATGCYLKNVGFNLRFILPKNHFTKKNNRMPFDRKISWQNAILPNTV
jgi:hypothetical protein